MGTNVLFCDIIGLVRPASLLHRDEVHTGKEKQ
jgi:hypothetical protein